MSTVNVSVLSWVKGTDARLARSVDARCGAAGMQARRARGRG